MTLYLKGAVIEIRLCHPYHRWKNRLFALSVVGDMTLFLSTSGQKLSRINKERDFLVAAENADGRTDKFIIKK